MNLKPLLFLMITGCFIAQIHAAQKSSRGCVFKVKEKTVKNVMRDVSSSTERYTAALSDYSMLIADNREGLISSWVQQTHFVPGDATKITYEVADPENFKILKHVYNKQEKIQ